MGAVLPVIGATPWGQTLNDALTSLQDNGLSANDAGFLSWNYSPQQVTGLGAAVSGTVKMVRLPRFTQPKTVTSVWFAVGAAAITPTAGQCFAAIYNIAGTRVGVTADIAALLGTPNLLTGWNLTAPVVCPIGDYYAALLQNAATPATLGLCATISFTDAQNAGLAAASAFHTDGPTVQTSMPASVTMSSRTRSGQPLWAGVK